MKPTPIEFIAHARNLKEGETRGKCLRAIEKRIKPLAMGQAMLLLAIATLNRKGIDANATNMASAMGSLKTSTAMLERLEGMGWVTRTILTRHKHLWNIAAGRKPEVNAIETELQRMIERAVDRVNGKESA